MDRIRFAHILGAAALVGCIDYGVDDTDDYTDVPVIVEERFVQSAAPAVDVLWVIDNTCSMAEEQDSLASAFEGFVDAITEVDVAWQIGVITTDVSDDSAGVLQGAPWVLTPQDASPVETFSNTVQVGTSGVAPESGLGAAWLALNAPLRDEENRGFRRADAGLHVIVVSDDDDDSSAVLGDDPQTAFLDFLEEEGSEVGVDVRLSAVVGDDPDGCTGARGEALPGTVYTQVAEASGGTVGSICDADLSGVLSDLGALSLDWQAVFTLQAAAQEDSLRVSLDGVRQDTGWVYESAPPSIVFSEAPGPDVEIRVRYWLLDSEA